MPFTDIHTNIPTNHDEWRVLLRRSCRWIQDGHHLVRWPVGLGRDVQDTVLVCFKGDVLTRLFLWHGREQSFQPHY